MGLIEYFLDAVRVTVGRAGCGSTITYDSLTALLNVRPVAACALTTPPRRT